MTTGDGGGDAGDDDDEQRREQGGTQPRVGCSPLAPACARDWVGSRHCAGLCGAVLCNVHVRQGEGAEKDLCVCVWTTMDESSGRE